MLKMYLSLGRQDESEGKSYSKSMILIFGTRIISIRLEYLGSPIVVKSSSQIQIRCSKDSHGAREVISKKISIVWEPLYVMDTTAYSNLSIFLDSKRKISYLSIRLRIARGKTSSSIWKSSVEGGVS